MFLTEQELQRQRQVDQLTRLAIMANTTRTRAEQLEGAADRAAQFGHKERAAEFRELSKTARAEHKRLTDEAHKAAGQI
jgi:hypothetical protein